MVKKIAGARRKDGKEMVGVRMSWEDGGQTGYPLTQTEDLQVRQG